MDRLHHKHTPEAIEKRLSQGPRISYTRDMVYGGIDGTVTTFAVVSGVMGAQLSLQTILILGFANLLADGFSMAAGNYVGTKTEHEEKSKIEKFERVQIKTNPDGERLEVRQILMSKGFEGELLDQAVDVITKDKDLWVKTMLTEEYGLSEILRSPSQAAFTTFFSFGLCGLVPLIPFLLPIENQFFFACLATAAAFFVIGSYKSRWTHIRWWRSGLETLAIGAGAATLSYVVGGLLKSLIS